MQLNCYKNAYGHDVVDCPFCKEWAYVHGKFADPLRGLKQHITLAAKNEVFEKSLVMETNDVSGPDFETKHLDYYKLHVSEKSIVKKVKREYDNDLKI
jgi:hypothetical protein